MRGKAKFGSEVGTETLIGTEEAIAKALESLGNEDKLLMFSDFDEQWINDMAVSMLISDYLKRKFRFNMLEELIKNFSVLRISLNRRGRTEVVSMITLQNLFEGGGRKKMTFRDLVAGMR